MKKKFLLTLMLALIAGLMTLASDFEVNDICYNINETGLTVTYSGRYYYSEQYYSGDVVIPETVTYHDTTYTVTAIGEHAFYHENVTSVTLPRTITRIEDSAFTGCSGIASVFIPKSVTMIGKNPFSQCNGLNSIVVEDGNPNYDSCGNGNVIIEKSTRALISGCVNSVIPQWVTSIGNNAFYGCSRITNVDLPDSLLSIGDYAFSCCYALKGIVIPNSVTSIGNQAFSSCKKMEYANIPEGIAVINNVVFGGCSMLSNIVIPNSVTSIGIGAFNGCTALTSIVIPEKVTYIGDRAFKSCSALNRVVIPRSVCSLGEDAFNSCSALNEVVIEDITAWFNIQFGNMLSNPLYYAKHFMLRDSDITHIDVPEGVQIVNSWVLTGYKGVLDVTIPNTVTTIDFSAFYQCSGLVGVTIPKSVKTIGNNAFYRCNHLTRVDIEDLMAWCDIDFLYVLGCESNPLKYAHRLYLNGNEITRLILPEGLERIKEDAFYGGGFSSVEIPHSVTIIDNWCFSNCTSLTSVKIPSSVVEIKSQVFQYCSNLTKLICEATTPQRVTSATFNNNNSDYLYDQVTLFVPYQSLDAYSSNIIWGRFSRIVPFVGAGPGDVNGDGKLSIGDVTGLIDVLLASGEMPAYCDVNGDGKVSIGDVTALINMLLSN